MRFFYIYAFLEAHKKLSLVRQLVRQILPFNASDYFLNYLHIADRISEEFLFSICSAHLSQCGQYLLQCSLSARYSQSVSTLLFL